MTPKLLFILLLALFATAAAQSDDELHIPEENDNQFPPVIHAEMDESPIEGSGAEEPLETTTVSSEAPPPLQAVQLSSVITNESVPDTDKLICPTQCICNTEGDSNKYIVDCSDAQLTELPKLLDPRTTDLNLQNNMLTVIPKEISELKNLKVLNVNNNKIMDVAAGSISELPELESLLLENNRLMEYPTDLKNSFGLTKLQEFDLGGNDMRTVLKAESFSIFNALRTLTLPSATPELIEDLCATLKESLVAVCIESCNNQQHDCPDAPDAMDDLDIVIPALIPSETDFEDNEDLMKSSASEVNKETGNEETVQSSPVPNAETTPIVESGGEFINHGVAFHSAIDESLPKGEPTFVVEEPLEADPKPTDDLPQTAEPNLTSAAPTPAEVETKSVETPPEPAAVPIPTAGEIVPTVVEPQPSEVETKLTKEEIITSAAAPRNNLEVKSESGAVGVPSPAAPRNNLEEKTESGVVGATTSSTKTGGVDKSIIAIVVAGMVVIVAGITIKKNWSSIRKRFSSSPRNDTDRTGINSNGTAPEEVPLQEKSPV